MEAVKSFADFGLLIKDAKTTENEPKELKFEFIGALLDSLGALLLINQSINQSISQSINQSINQSIDQSINQSINQSVNQSINQSIIYSDFKQKEAIDLQFSKFQ